MNKQNQFLVKPNNRLTQRYPNPMKAIYITSNLFTLLNNNGMKKLKDFCLVAVAILSLLFTVNSNPLAAQQILSPPNLPSSGWNFNGNKVSIGDYNSVARLQAGINQLRRNEEGILGICPNAIANIVFPDQATWDRYNDEQKMLFIINDERRARGGIIYNTTKITGDRIGPKGAVRGYPFSGVPTVVDNAADWWTDWLVANNKGIRHCDDDAPADRRCPGSRIKSFGNPCLTPHAGLEGMSSVNAPTEVTVGIRGLLGFTYGTTGHRQGVLNQWSYKDDFGNPREEGYVGFGTVKTSATTGMLAFKMGDTPSDEHIKANGNCSYNWKAKTSDLPGCTRFLAATSSRQAMIAGSNYTVNWTSSPCAREKFNNIRIRLSVDGGQTFPDNLIITQSTPVADGSETIQIPASVNTAAAVVKIESVGSTCHYFSDVVTAPLDAVIGIDFEERTDRTAENWTRMRPAPNAEATNLSVDDGKATGVNFSITASGCPNAGCYYNHGANTVNPKHAKNIGSLIDGTSFLVGPVKATWSNLKPNTAYRVYVFAGTRNLRVDVSISNFGGSPVTFTQGAGHNWRLQVNGQLPASNSTLQQYAQTVHSSATGTIEIDMTSSGSITLMGMALQSLDRTYPAPNTGGGNTGGGGNTTPVALCTPTVATPRWASTTITNFELKDAENKVVFANSQNNGTVNYENFTADQSKHIKLRPGANLNYTVNSTGNGPTDIWIDINRDGTLQLETERIHYKSVGGSSPIKTGQFTLPNLPDGAYFMRLRVMPNYSSNPCAGNTWGQVEDYTLQVSSSTSPIATGTYTLTARHSNKVLDANESGNVLQWEANNSSSQRWIVEHVGGGPFFYLRSVGRNGRYMEISGRNRDANVRLGATSKGNTRQQFKVVAIGNYYQIVPRDNENIAIDIQGNSVANGKNALLWTKGTGNNQQFTFTLVGGNL